MKVFPRLMLHGQVHSAIRFLTDKTHSGGVLLLDVSMGLPGHSVLDILHEKHPASPVVVESAFLPCEVLPHLNITADYRECLVHQIQGSNRPGGSIPLQWQGYLLQYGASSVHLRIQSLYWPVVWLLIDAIVKQSAVSLVLI